MVIPAETLFLGSVFDLRQKGLFHYEITTIWGAKLGGLASQNETASV